MRSLSALWGASYDTDRGEAKWHLQSRHWESVLAVAIAIKKGGLGGIMEYGITPHGGTDFKGACESTLISVTVYNVLHSRPTYFSRPQFVWLLFSVFLSIPLLGLQGLIIF